MHVQYWQSKDDSIFLFRMWTNKVKSKTGVLGTEQKGCEEMWAGRCEQEIEASETEVVWTCVEEKGGQSGQEGYYHGGGRGDGKRLIESLTP